MMARPMKKELRDQISEHSEQLILMSKELIQRSREIMQRFAFVLDHWKALRLPLKKKTKAASSHANLP